MENGKENQKNSKKNKKENKKKLSLPLSVLTLYIWRHLGEIQVIVGIEVLK